MLLLLLLLLAALAATQLWAAAVAALAKKARLGLEIWWTTTWPPSTHRPRVRCGNHRPQRWWNRAET